MTKIRLKLNPWFDTRPRFRLSDAEIQMAHELGLNLKKFGFFSTEEKQQWKLPLRVVIAECYFKRFKRELPELVRTFEVIDAEDALRKPSNGTDGYEVLNALLLVRIAARVCRVFLATPALNRI